MGGGKQYKTRQGPKSLGAQTFGAQTVTALGRHFRCTNVNACDGQKIQIYNRTHEEVEADVAAYCTYAPLCIGDPYGSIIDATGWNNPDVNELFCIVINDTNKAGDYTFYLYYEDTLTFSFTVSCEIGESVFWYAGNGEVPGNGNYQVDIRDPDGITVATRTFTLINYPEEPYLNVTPLSHNSPAEGETFAISVESNIAWTASKDVPWVNIQVSSESGESPQYGSGDGIITVTVDENTGTTVRVWHITVEGGGESHTRTYTQAGAVPTTCDQQFYLEDADTGEYITGATVEVGGVECENEYPSIERYQKDDLVVGSWYNVVASKTGYTCPDDICKDTFEACGNTITLKLKKEDLTCDQPFKVEDQNGDPVEGAEVSATDLFLGTVYGPCTTDSNGECSITIETGVDVYGFISALPDGYEGTPTTDIFTACVGVKTLVVTKAVGTIESYSAPGELDEGEELIVSFIAKNIGPAHGTLGGFQMHLWIDDVKYDTTPKLLGIPYWKSLDHDEPWEDEVNTIGSIPLWSMPNHDVNVKIVLEDKDEGDQASEEFVVALKGEAPTLNLQPTKTVITPTEEICPEVYCPAGIDNVCIYIDSVKTSNCANSGLKANIKCKPMYPNDFDKITGNDLGGIGKHNLQAKTSTLASNIVEITVQSDSDIGEIVEPVLCSAKKQFLGGYEITATVTVKNIGTKEYEYKVKMFDAKSGEHLDTEEFDWKNILPSETADIVLTTEWKTKKSSTPEVKFELWECNRQIILCDERKIDTKVVDCAEEPFFDIPWIAIMYGGIAILVGTLGSILPGKIGKVVPIFAIVPGGLCVYSLYKEYVDKIPFLSNAEIEALEQLALPPKLTEPLRKKKVLL